METFEDGFYLVLPSNSSMSYFPDNTTACFTTQLCHEIRFIGEWVVGLAEIHVPCTIMHIQKTESWFTFKLGSAEGKRNPTDEIYSFPQGVYDSVEQLAAEINRTRDIDQHQRLEPTEFQKGYYALRRKCSCKQPHYTTFNEKIRRIFGFEDPVHRVTGTFGIMDGGYDSSSR